MQFEQDLAIVRRRLKAKDEARPDAPERRTPWDPTRSGSRAGATDDRAAVRLVNESILLSAVWTFRSADDPDRAPLVACVARGAAETILLPVGTWDASLRLGSRGLGSETLAPERVRLSSTQGGTSKVERRLEEQVRRDLAPRPAPEAEDEDPEAREE